MVQKYRLPINVRSLIEVDERGRMVDTGLLIREPELYGAETVRWGQLEHDGTTMLVRVEADAAEHDKIPAEARR